MVFFAPLQLALHVSMITSIYEPMIVFHATGITCTSSCLSKIFALGFYCNSRVNADVFQVSRVYTTQTHSTPEITRETGYSPVLLANVEH